MSIDDNDTIAAIATPPGIGGVGIVRISGPDSPVIGRRICTRFPEPRTFQFSRFHDLSDQPIDEGIVLYFPAPASFTGEHTVELQGHGGPVVLNLLLETVLKHGARLARPGEFSERAFFNGKMDLLQVEAVADLIESQTDRAAKLASRTLTGEFSARIHQLLNDLTALRAFVEAAVDFPDEDIDLLQTAQVNDSLRDLQAAVERVFSSASQGRLLRDGMTIVIAGRPNAGKSSLLNALAGYESAIVTPQAGTTRDLMKERIQIDGLPLHIVDTAGLREISDQIEQEGIRRAKREIRQADRILWMFADEDTESAMNDARRFVPESDKFTLIRNKIDLQGRSPEVSYLGDVPIVSLSAKTGLGMDTLREHLKQCVGFDNSGEGEFLARQRHLDALSRVRTHIEQAGQVYRQTLAGELMAEELRLAQNALSEITGEFVTDDLLGEIFGRFCIGK